MSVCMCGYCYVLTKTHVLVYMLSLYVHFICSYVYLVGLLVSVCLLSCFYICFVVLYVYLYMT